MIIYYTETARSLAMPIALVQAEVEKETPKQFRLKEGTHKVLLRTDECSYTYGYNYKYKSECYTDKSEALNAMRELLEMRAFHLNTYLSRAQSALEKLAEMEAGS